MIKLTKKEFEELSKDKPVKVTWFKERFWDKPIAYLESFSWEGLSKDRPPISGPKTRYLYDGVNQNKIENFNFIEDLMKPYKELGCLTRLILTYTDYSIIKIIFGKVVLYYKDDNQGDPFQISLEVLKGGFN